MERRKQSDVYDYVLKLNQLGAGIAVNFHSAGGRITTSDQMRDISPRLKIGELMTWLDGFRAAIDIYKSEGIIERIRNHSERMKDFYDTTLVNEKYESNQDERRR